MKNILLTIALLTYGFLGIAQNTNTLKISLSNASYLTKSHKIVLNIVFTNVGRDTLLIVKPIFHRFNENYRFQEYHFTGEIHKPYSLNVQINKACEQEAEQLFFPPKPPPKKLYLSKDHVFKLAPGEVSKNYNVKIELRADQQFCEEGEYEMSVNYQTNYELLKSEQVDKLKELRKEIELVLAESKEYIEKIGMSSSREIIINRENVHRQLNAERIKQSLNGFKTLTNAVPLRFEVN